MAQIKRKNSTKGVSKVGQLVKLDPNNPKAFVNVTDLTQLPVIGAVAQAVPPGNMALINLIGGYNMDTQTGQVIISPVPPTSPAVGTIWIESSII
jgi:hypothetical protein